VVHKIMLGETPLLEKLERGGEIKATMAKKLALANAAFDCELLIRTTFVFALLR
jgi:hypothetical protein